MTVLTLKAMALWVRKSIIWLSTMSSSLVFAPSADQAVRSCFVCANIAGNVALPPLLVGAVPDADAPAPRAGFRPPIAVASTAAVSSLHPTCLESR
jgi:hypothetical protein